MLHCAYARTVTLRSIPSSPPVVDQGSDEGAPSGLVRRAESRAIVAVVELVKEDQVLPVRVLLELLRSSVDRPLSSLVSGKDADHAVGDLPGHPEEIPVAVLVSLKFDPEVVPIAGAECAQRLDDQEAGWKPHRTTPIRVAALDLVIRFRGIVANLGVPEGERVLAVISRQAANAVIGQKLIGVQKPLEYAPQLVFIHDRQFVLLLLVEIVAAALGELHAILHEPPEVRLELLKSGDIGESQRLSGVDGNDAHERADSELGERSVGEAQHVVEEAVVFIPQRVLPAAHVLHRGADVDVMLEKLEGEALVGSAF